MSTGSAFRALDLVVAVAVGLTLGLLITTLAKRHTEPETVATQPDQPITE